MSETVRRHEEEEVVARVTRATTPQYSSATLTRATVNLTPKAVHAIKQVADLTSDTRTDIINRSVQVYAEIQQVLNQGGELYVRPEKDADLQQLRIW